MAKAPSASTDDTAATPAVSETVDNAAGGQIRIRWDDSNMTNTYANVCNVSSTREEMTLLFGTNQTWHTGQSEVTVQLTNRIIVNPYAAKRMSMLLTNVVAEYEKRFGELKIETGSTGAGDQS